MNDLKKFQLSADQAVLVVVDIQERLVTAMPEQPYQRMRNTVAMLAAGAAELGVPIVTTEQYPQGIGHTVAELAESCARGAVVEKVSFGCCGEPAFLEAIEQTGRRQVIVTGMEAHVCVYLTVLGLLEAGYPVHLVEDGICSRRKQDFQAAVASARQAGAVAVTAEMVLFQMLQDSRHASFRAISKLIKAR